MNRILLSLCFLTLPLATVPSLTDTDNTANTATANGVLAEERVINLPNDQGAWYISVVGNANDATYVRLLGWFDNNPSLKTLKNKVHFCPVTTGTPIYQERYASNVKGLPTVRMQRANGVVVYEATGQNIPMTADLWRECQADQVLASKTSPVSSLPKSPKRLLWSSRWSRADGAEGLDFPRSRNPARNLGPTDDRRLMDASNPSHGRQTALSWP